MKRRLGLVLLLCCWMLHLGSGLKCYTCADMTGTCDSISGCGTDNSCLTLTSKSGLITHQCIRYADCTFTVLAQMFPTSSGFTFNCCSSDLCNSGNRVTTATPILTAVGLLLSVCWCWI